ncbi:MAG: DEAD/DEAH box helicase family protein [Nitrosarchaeum sp.]|nr:DEAD/DEAH box helicase family protein [Nitrosarchaeum sp.]
MPIPDDYSMESTNREMCIKFFKKLFTRDELKEEIQKFSPEKLTKKSNVKYQKNRKSFFEILKIQEINDETKLAAILYDLLGPHFLYEVQGVGSMDKHSQMIRYDIFKKAIELKWFSLDTVSKVSESLSKIGKITKLEEINSLRIPGPWQHKLLELLSNDLPSETVEAPSKPEESKQNMEVITAIRELLPLHDYQIFAGKKIRDLLVESKNIRKRLLISIPTGAGKTRLVAESLIDWLNDGKPSDDPKIHNSKYMVWIAQSRELCEQAISQFNEIYSQKGKSALTVFRLFGTHNITLETVLAQRVEHGLIVCTIDKIYEQINDKTTLSEFNADYFQNNIEYDDRVLNSNLPQKYYDDWAFGKLRSVTSCVIVDEAHKAIMPMYTCVLRGLGFNFKFTADENKCNEAGITLVGLTATAFRGTGLERSRKVTIGKHSENKVHLISNDTGSEKHTEVEFPINCAECNKPLLEGEEVLQATSNNKILWHKYEQKLSAETERIYTRFNIPLIPKIYGFQENKKPRAIITCNEKFVANNPIRISGEKSYDLLGSIVKYSWSIERKSNLIEVFGMGEIKEIKVHPKSLPTIVEELKEPGTYLISLTVENYDGLTDTAIKVVEVIPDQQIESSNEMKDLIMNLIKREILCEVFHTSIKSGKIGIAEKKSIDILNQIRKQAAENDERNEKLVKIIHYLTTKPQEKRKKILVFACDILHARFLVMWLKTKYDISADYVDSQLHESRNISRIRKFREKSNEQCKILINTNMLTTGFDVPDVDCVIMGRPVISTVEYTQMIGRGMRGPRMGGTREVWIIDFDDQVQLSEHMENQTIPLGWKSMAYDNENKLLWKPLTDKKDNHGNPLNLDIDITNEKDVLGGNKTDDENKDFSIKCRSCTKSSIGFLEISRDYDLTKDEKEDLTLFIEKRIAPKFPVLKICKQCKDEINIWPESNNPWKNLIVKEKSNPVLLQLIKFIAKNYDGNLKIDTTKIFDVEYTVKSILEYVYPDLGFNQLRKELEAFQEDDYKILKDMIQNAKEKIEKERLVTFFTNYLILQKNISMTQKLIALCNHYLDLDVLKNAILEKKHSIEETHPLDERLRSKTKTVIFDKLGYIPEEQTFKENVGNVLYDFMLKKYLTYNRFQVAIHINEYVIKLRERSSCLNEVISIYNNRQQPLVIEYLMQNIPNFKLKINANFDTVENFMQITEQITRSIKDANRPVDFTQLKNDYELVKSQTPWTPSTEEIFRHSKLGIGYYIRYAGSIANFQNVYELNDDIKRTNLEKLKNKFFEIKGVLKKIPDEETMKKHSIYSEVMQSLWFTTYEDFLKFLGQNPTEMKPSNVEYAKESKNELIISAKAMADKNGMQELFEKIVREPELKFLVHFGSMEKFIEAVFPNNKQIALMRWKDIKNKSKKLL